MASDVRTASGQILDDLIQLVARSRQQSHEYVERFGVTVPQSGVLQALHESGQLPIGTLADKLLLKTSTVSGIVDRLERGGYVRRNRDNEDRRVVLVALTEKGRLLSCRLPGTTFDKLRRALERLEPREAHALLRLLRQVLDYIEKEESSDAVAGL